MRWPAQPKTKTRRIFKMKNTRMTLLALFGLWVSRLTHKMYSFDFKVKIIVSTSWLRARQWKVFPSLVPITVQQSIVQILITHRALVRKTELFAIKYSLKMWRPRLVKFQPTIWLGSGLRCLHLKWNPFRMISWVKRESVAIWLCCASKTSDWKSPQRLSSYQHLALQECLSTDAISASKPIFRTCRDSVTWWR